MYKVGPATFVMLPTENCSSMPVLGTTSNFTKEFCLRQACTQWYSIQLGFNMYIQSKLLQHTPVMVATYSSLSTGQFSS